MSDIERKKQLKAAFKAKERQDFEASIPLPKEDFKALFDYLDGPDIQPYDHTLKFTLKFLENPSIDPQRAVPWLRDQGGYCDCEVLANVEEIFEK